MMTKRFQSAPGGKRLHSRRGWTLVEMMVAMLAGSIVLAALVAITTFVSKSYIAIGNYTDLDSASRIALDTMSRDIRNAAGLAAYSTNAIVLINQDGTLCEYAWNPATSLFTRYAGTNQTVLLRNCDILDFKVYQRNPTNDFQFVPTTSPAEGKLIDVSWRCSRSILGAIINSESVQTAKIVIRNH